MSDQKESLKSGRKPDLSYLHKATAVYAARACEYGNAKGYTRGNYIVKGEAQADALERCRAYVAAILRHTLEISDALERDGDLYAADTDTAGDFPASGLPHIAGAVASINMLLEIAIGAGLLPADPGQPWTKEETQNEVVEESDNVVTGETISPEGYRTEHGTLITRRYAPCGCARYWDNRYPSTEHYQWYCIDATTCCYSADRSLSTEVHRP